MIEVFNIIMCCIGIGATIGFVIGKVIDAVTIRCAEKRYRQRKLECITREVENISDTLKEIKVFFEDR